MSLRVNHGTSWSAASPSPFPQPRSAVRNHRAIPPWQPSSTPRAQTNNPTDPNMNFHPRLEISLVGFGAMLQPPGSMATTWVVMCPVDYAALGVPLIHAAEGDSVTYAKGTDS